MSFMREIRLQWAWLREAHQQVNHGITLILRRMDIMTSRVDVAIGLLGEINAATTEIGESIDDHAADITDAIAKLQDADVPQAVLDGLTATRDSLKSVADRARDVAAAYPPQEPSSEAPGSTPVEGVPTTPVGDAESPDAGAATPPAPDAGSVLE